MCFAILKRSKTWGPSKRELVCQGHHAHAAQQPVDRRNDPECDQGGNRGSLRVCVTEQSRAGGTHAGTELDSAPRHWAANSTLSSGCFDHEPSSPTLAKSLYSAGFQTAAPFGFSLPHSLSPRGWRMPSRHKAETAES